MFHRGLDSRVTHQLLLDGERRPSIVQPRLIAVAKSVPTDIAIDLGLDTRFAKVILLNLLMTLRFNHYTETLLRPTMWIE